MPPAGPDPEPPPSPAVVSLPALEAEDPDLLFFFPEEREPLGVGDLPAICSVSMLKDGEERTGEVGSTIFSTSVTLGLSASGGRGIDLPTNSQG
jgi:hypothetical protein